jgi:DNA-binding protein Fis
VIAPEHLALPTTTGPADFANCIARMTRDLMDSAPGEVHQRCLHRCRAPLLRQVLAHTGDNYLRSGALLGINRATLKRWVDEAGLADTP